MDQLSVVKIVGKFCVEFYKLENTEYYTTVHGHDLFVPVFRAYRDLIALLKSADTDQRKDILRRMDMDPKKYVTTDTYPLYSVLYALDYIETLGNYDTFTLLLLRGTGEDYIVNSESYLANEVPNAFYNVSFIELLEYLPEVKPITAHIEKIRNLDIEARINNRASDKTFVINNGQAGETNGKG